MVRGDEIASTLSRMADAGTWTCRHCQTNNAQDRDRCSYCRKHRRNDITVTGILAVVVLAAIILAFVAFVLTRIYA
jgi:recombinational DNA repair protein RecR